jgi:hypothetical protein
VALKEYKVRTRDGRTETMLLSEKDAERLKATPIEAKPAAAAKAKTPANKAATPQNKGGAAATTKAKAATPAPAGTPAVADAGTPPAE